MEIVEITQDKQDGLDPGEIRQQTHDGRSEVELIGRGICQLLDLAADPEGRHEVHERWESSSQVAALGVRPTRYVTLQRYCERAIGKVVAVCAGAAREDPGPRPPRLARQLLDESGLSDAGF